MRILALALLLSLNGCVDVRYFVPSEPRNATGPGGVPASVYPFGASDVAGRVWVWSDGANGERTVGGSEDYRVEVHVGFELQNTGATAVELGDVRSTSDALELARSEGSTVVPPGETRRVDMWFAARNATSALDVPDFAIRHSIVAGGIDVATQDTEFERFRAPRNPLDHDPYYRGWGWGPFWGKYRGTGRFVDGYGPESLRASQ